MTSRKVMRCWFTKVNQIDWRDTMNTRKNIDYSEMYEVLDKLMEQLLPQMKLYCEIGCKC